MFDTMTLTKTMGAFCGSLLILLVGKWGAETLYHVGGGGHGEKMAVAYVVLQDDGGAEDKPKEEGPSFEEMLAQADVGKGAKVYAKCKACHKLEDGAHATGPSLYGIVGRAIGGTDFGSYSGKLGQAGETWDAATLNAFLTKPKSLTPGTSMSFAGLKKLKDRANLIAYLDSIDD